MKKIYHSFFYIFSFVFELIFPLDTRILELEALTPEAFLEKVSPLKTIPPHGIKSICNYRDPFVQQALWELKYSGNRIIATLFGSLLYSFIINTLSSQKITNPLLIPLPLSQTRRKERGWNQSEMLVKEIIAHDTSHLFSYSFSVLIKHKHTEPQTHLSRKKRMQNLKGCFAIKNAHLIKNRTIILIDDVTTTGSTIKEAMDTLAAAGAQNVKAFTIAH